MGLESLGKVIGKAIDLIKKDPVAKKVGEVVEKEIGLGPKPDRFLPDEIKPRDPRNVFDGGWVKPESPRKGRDGQWLLPMDRFPKQPDNGNAGGIATPGQPAHPKNGSEIIIGRDGKPRLVKVLDLNDLSNPIVMKLKSNQALHDISTQADNQVKAHLGDLINGVNNLSPRDQIGAKNAGVVQNILAAKAEAQKRGKPDPFPQFNGMNKQQIAAKLNELSSGEDGGKAARTEIITRLGESGLVPPEAMSSNMAAGMKEYAETQRQQLEAKQKAGGLTEQESARLESLQAVENSAESVVVLSNIKSNADHELMLREKNRNKEFQFEQLPNPNPFDPRFRDPIDPHFDITDRFPKNSEPIDRHFDITDRFPQNPNPLDRFFDITDRLPRPIDTRPVMPDHPNNPIYTRPVMPKSPEIPEWVKPGPGDPKDSGNAYYL